MRKSLTRFYQGVDMSKLGWQLHQLRNDELGWIKIVDNEIVVMSERSEEFKKDFESILQQTTMDSFIISTGSTTSTSISVDYKSGIS